MVLVFLQLPSTSHLPATVILFLLHLADVIPSPWHPRKTSSSLGEAAQNQLQLARSQLTKVNPSAGVVGLDVALVLAKQGLGPHITVIAEHLPGDTSALYTSPWYGNYPRAALISVRDTS